MSIELFRSLLKKQSGQIDEFRFALLFFAIRQKGKPLALASSFEHAPNEKRDAHREHESVRAKERENKRGVKKRKETHFVSLSLSMFQSFFLFSFLFSLIFFLRLEEEEKKAG